MGAEQGQFLGKPPERQPKLTVVIGGEFYSGFDITRQFLKRAMVEGADQRPPTKEIRDTWTRNIEITRGYGETQDSLEDIGRKYGIGRERVRQIFAQTIRSLWLNCSKETQRLFSIEQIPLRKPLPQPIRERISRSRGGRSVAIAEMLREGKTPEGIRQQILPTGSWWLANTRRTLKNWGLELPHLITPPKQNRELAIKLANPRLSDFEIEKLLSQVSRRFLSKDRAREQPLLTPVVHIVSECGFHYHLSETPRFINSLRTAGIPVGKLEHMVKSRSQKRIVHYCFIVTQHVGRAKEALKSNPDLEPFLKHPVKQICGPQGKLPSTYQLLRRKGYVLTSRVFAELEIRTRGRQRNIGQRDVLTNKCPVPVFRYRQLSYCRKEEADVLKDFIRKSLGL